MNKILAFISAHAVMSAVTGFVLLLLFGIALLFRPLIVVAILRYATAAVSIALGCFLLIRTLIRATK